MKKGGCGGNEDPNQFHFFFLFSGEKERDYST